MSAPTATHVVIGTAGPLARSRSCQSLGLRSRSGTDWRTTMPDDSRPLTSRELRRSTYQRPVEYAHENMGVGTQPEKESNKVLCDTALLNARKTICESISPVRVEAQMRSMDAMAMDSIKEPWEQHWSMLNAEPLDQFMTPSEIVTFLADNSQKIFGTELDEVETLMLSHFITFSEERQVDSPDELAALARVYKVYTENSSSWSDILGGHYNLASVLTLMRELNPDARVLLCEAQWVMDMSTSFCPDPTLDGKTLLMSISFWYLTPLAEASSGLHRQRLIERLHIEHKFGRGMTRLLNLFALFMFLTTAVTYSGKMDYCRGIKDNLSTNYGLDELYENNVALKDVKAYLKEFSKQSALFGPLSAEYVAESSDKILVDRETHFRKPIELPDVEFTLGQEFSFSSWMMVQKDITLPKQGVPILRKALSTVGKAADLSCWSWSFPPALNFGAHDYGGPRSAMEERVIVDSYYSKQERDGLYPERGQLVMHTVAVNLTHAVFMKDDGNLLETVPLSRPFTDCKSKALTMGSGGITLAALRFFPRALTAKEVAEIHLAGSMMSDVGYMITPILTEPLDELGALDRKIEQTPNLIRELDGVSERRQWEAAAMTTGAMRNPGSGGPKTEYVNDNHTIDYKTADPTLQLPFFEAFSKPIFMGKSSQVLAPGSALPRVQAAGMTISVWLKRDQVAGQGFVIGKSIPQKDKFGNDYFTGYDSLCWYAYFGGAYTVWNHKSSTPGVGWGPVVGVDETTAPRSWHFTGKTFRHFTFQVDPSSTTKPITMCIDGTCNDKLMYVNNLDKGLAADCEDASFLQSDHDTPEQRADALSKAVLAFNHRAPGAWYGIGDMMNFKIFKKALSDEEMKQLFLKDPDPDNPSKPIRETRGCKYPSEQTDDPDFRDEFGHNCYWFYNSRDVCKKNEAAAKACPTACQSVETCWGSQATTGSSMQIWHRWMEFKPKGSWGTTCVGKSTTPAKEAIQCGLNALVVDPKRCAEAKVQKCGPQNCTAHENDLPKLKACLGDVTWVRPDENNKNLFIPCNDIIELHDETCDWDDSELDKVAEGIANSTEWSMTFWMEAKTTECDQPQMRFLDGSGNTFSWVGSFSNGMVLDRPAGDGCLKDGFLSHGLIGKAEKMRPRLGEADLSTSGKIPIPGQKRLIVLGRGAQNKVKLDVDTDSATDEATSNGGPPPIRPNKGFLRVINVHGNVRLSPITLSSAYPSAGEVTTIRYRDLEEQQRRPGTSVRFQEQKVEKVDRIVKTFSQKSMLVTPPLLIQQRRTGGPCPSKFADGVIAEYLSMAKQVHCSGLYECPNLGNMYECPGDPDEGSWFGLPSLSYLHQKVFVEYLSIISDNPFLVRKNASAQPEVMDTTKFMDTLTTKVEIAAIFFSLEFGITTSLQITFDTQGGRVKASHAVKHYVALAKGELDKYLMLQYMAIVFNVILAVNLFFGIRQTIKDIRNGEIDKGHIILQCYDVVLQLGCIIYMYLVISEKRKSLSMTEDLVGRILKLKWFDKQTGYEEKKQDYLGIFEDLFFTIETSNFLESVGMLVTVQLLIRMVIATSAHPRIALITETMSVAISDMCHFFFIFAIVFYGFAVIAWWRFGGHREDLQSIWAALVTQFDSMLGPPAYFELSHGKNDEDWEYVVFCFLFHTIMFLFMLNFLLAIIVDAYVRVKGAIADCVVEEDIVSDLVAAVRTKYMSVRYGWPARKTMLKHIEQIGVTFLNPKDLKDLGFRNDTAMNAFFKFYSRFTVLLSAPEVDKHTLADVNVSVVLNSQKLDHLNLKMQQFEQRMQQNGKHFEQLLALSRADQAV